MAKTSQRNAGPTSAPDRHRRIGPFVYGVTDERLFVVPRKIALDCARWTRALNTSATWGEVTAQAPRRLCREVRETLGVRRIAADRDISDILEELADQNYPASLGSVMLVYLPDELAGLVQHECSAIGDALPSLPADALPQVLAVLGAHGMVCVEDQTLIAEANGYVADAPDEIRS